MPTSGRSLYFHIPFCHKKCPYCHFFVLPNDASLKKRFLCALFSEWEERAPLLQNCPITSIYFGGGTPSLIGPEAIAQILAKISRNNPACEITLEINPEGISLEEMRAFAAVGINRVSIGVQSLDDALLKILGRTHSAKEALFAIETTHRAGIENISIDLMYEVPHQTLSVWEKTLSLLPSLPLKHLSLYNLTFEEGSLFYKERKEWERVLPAAEEGLKMLELATRSLPIFGLNRYEISAFAKEGFFSRHNVGYWTARPFLGFGPSAFSYWNGCRFRNICHLARYETALREKRSPVNFEEKLPFPKNLEELLAVQLRLIQGVDLSLFPPLPESIWKKVERLLAKGWLTLKGSQLQLSEEGLLFYDSVASEII